ncbi:hypothetical protein [Actinotignum urinale]|uniref:hypothetical protein n=1 Tax=Actinotignum urinale TaxID=190146 RepID=UPI0003B4ACEF|nr:hypothetical protein [Actinotignum urinale]MDY5159559.1 hypothetical protein [Actinotignum urinale]
MLSLGFLGAEWIEAHCRIPDSWNRGEPFVLAGWQLENLVYFYEVKPGAVFNPVRPAGASVFVYRRGVIVGPQKTGKSPFGAAIVCLEAVGPCVFAGWAEAGDMYRCVDNGCGCGWEYTYQEGDPMGMVRPTNLIQLLATAEDQTDNVYGPLKEMINLGPLGVLMQVREGFIRLPNGGRIDPVTTKASTRLGQQITFALADESGLYTGKIKTAWDTMRRGLAGMDGRGLEITNPWDPMDNSSAQATFQSNQDDIYKFYRRPPSSLSWERKRDRKKILEYVYEGSPWVNLETVEREMEELVETDPTQARRFFLNQLVQGQGSFMTEELWDKTEQLQEVPQGAPICLGFDGSRSDDWTAIRAETLGGYRFTPVYGPDSRPTYWDPKLWPGSRIPRGEVDAAISHLFEYYDVQRLYIDPRHWETQADKWAGDYGVDRVVQWPTNSTGRMFDALTRYSEDSFEGLTTHDDDLVARAHALHARRVAKPGDKYVLGKPAEHMKIDILMADVLAHEAASDMRALGWSKPFVDSRMFVW